MARVTHVAFLLHMHQPLYVDPQTRRAEMPWVRLHGARGYLDVAWLLEQYPGVSLTVNFVPSLLEQLDQLVAGTVADRYEQLCLQPGWTPAEREQLLEKLFSVHWARCVEPRPRYRELLERRGRELTTGQLAERARLFSDGDLRDLTVLFHLGWLGFAARAIDRSGDGAIAALEAKGRDYDLDDLRTVLAAGRAACARVLPLYRRLAERGQVELSSSPYYHPIVPLLVDSDATRRALPHAQLPSRFAWPDDGREQIARGRAAHERRFGSPPVGMWPPEGSVSPEAVALYRAEGIRWLATDEGNLWRSLRLAGHGERPRGELYQAWRHDGVDLVFRDRELSDRIGFSYAFGDPEAGVADLLGRAREAGASAPGETALVPVILDGENPWESYDGSGEPFLRALFARLERSGDLRGVSVGQHLAQVERRGDLPSLHSGSWIDSDFHIWIADPVKNRAWELLGRARKRLERAAAAGTKAADLAAAREHLLAAEGSDWFWWFGQPFHSAEDATFDRLFRAHLAAAWAALGDAPPAELEAAVDPGRTALAMASPRGLISPTVDGRVGSYFEWIDAGRYEVPRGAAMAEEPLAQALHFGCDRDKLYVRIDLAAAGRAAIDVLSLEVLIRDGRRELSLEAPLSGGAFRGSDRLLDGEAAPSSLVGAIGRLATAEIAEAEIPFAPLRLVAGAPIELSLRLREGELIRARLPRDAAIGLAVPDEGFVADHWWV